MVLAVGGLVAGGGLLGAGCPAEGTGPELTVSPESPDDPAEVERAERTGEAQDPWTRAECQAAFVRNIRFCDTWTVTTRPTCYAVMAGLHVACVKQAED